MTSAKLYRLTATVLPQPAVPQAVSTQSNQHILIVDDGSPLTAQLLAQLPYRPLVLQANRRPLGAPLLAAALGEVGELETLLQRIKAVEGGLAGVIFLATQPLSGDLLTVGKESLKQARAAIALARALCDGPGTIQFMAFVTAQGSLGVEARAKSDLLAAGLEALAHPLALETPQVTFRSIDLDPSTSPAIQAAQVLQELTLPAGEHRHSFAYTAAGRVTLALMEREAPQGNLGPQPVVVFAGGARGIGAVCAQTLAERSPGAKIIFLGRTPLDHSLKPLLSLDTAGLKQAADSFQKEYRLAHPDESPKAAREAWEKKLQTLSVFQTLADLEKAGATAEYLPGVDVRSQSSVAKSFQAVVQQYGRVDAVVYVAGAGGAATDRILTRKRWDIIDQVIETKLLGALYLLEAAKGARVKLFLSFGSIASRFGNKGQVDYACGNAFLTGLTKFHNASGVLPRAKMLGWGAWDGVGMAVSGPTRDQLVAYGVEFITPAAGGQYFYEQLTPNGDEEVYVTPNWLGLEEFLVPSAQKKISFRYLSEIQVHEPGQKLIATCSLDPVKDPYLGDHRLQGVSWVPAMLGIDVASEAGTFLCPGLTAHGVRDVVLTKAIRLVRDEPMTLRTEAQLISRTADGAEVHVQLFGQTPTRSWTFCEMRVLLAAQPPTEFNLDYSWPSSPVPLQHLDRDQIYPSLSLPHQTGPSYQVIDTIDLQAQLGQATATVTLKELLPEGCCFPFSLSDGILQVHQVLATHWLNQWCGPPLYFREIQWTPEAMQTLQIQARMQDNPTNPDQDPVVAGYVDGRCIWYLKGKGQGGTDLNRKPNRPSLDSYPFLSEVTEHTSQRILARKILNPATELLLQHHIFFGYVFVPAVYFMEVSIEASARLVNVPPVALLNFQIHKAYQMVSGPKDLWVEVVVKERFRGGEVLTEVRTSSKPGEYHTSALVLHRAEPIPLGRQLPMTLERPLLTVGQALYDKKRIRNGPIYQVLKDIAVTSDPAKGLGQANLVLQNPLGQGCYLPLTLLDGLLQLEAVTRTGYDETCGIPKSYQRILWDCEQTHSQTVIGQAEILGQRDNPQNWGYLSLAEQGRIILRVEGSTVTPGINVKVGGGK